MIEIPAQGVRSETSDGHPFTVTPDHVTGVDTADDRNIVRNVPIRSSPLSPWLLAWIGEEGEGWLAPTLMARAYSAQRLSRASLEVEKPRVPEVWSRFLFAMRGELAEGTARTNTSLLLDFMDWCLAGELITPTEHRTIEARYRHEFKGYSERHRRRREARTHFSVDVLASMYRAIRMEMEEVEAVLEGGCDKGLHTLSALSLFPLLMAVDQGLRSTELNAMAWQDVGARPDHLFVHGRNKATAYLPMPSYAGRAWETARRWMEAYRPAEGVMGHEPALVYRRLDGKVARLRATQLRWYFLPRYFYPKYFARTDADGDPILAKPNCETGELEPLDAAFYNLRHMAITAVARFEPDPDVVRRFARHRSIYTTRINYITITQDQRRWTVAARLGPLAEKVRMTLQGRVALAEELERAEAVGAMLPVGGACAEALKGNFGCMRANDCRVCEHFLIDVRMRSFFAQSAEKHEGEAARAREQKGYRRDPENLMALAAIDRAIVRIIDERQAGLI